MNRREPKGGEARPDARESHIKRVLLAIRNVNQLIVHEDDPERLIQRACEHLTETLGYYNAWIALIEDDGSVSRIGVSGFDGGFEAMRAALSRRQYAPCMREAMQRDGVVVRGDPPADCRDCPLSCEYAGRAGLAHRLAHEGRTYGTLTVSVPKEYAADEEEQSYLREVAGDLAFALRKMQADRELRESEQRFRTLFDGTQDALFLHDTEGRILEVNEAACRRLGYGRDELLRMTPRDFDAPEFAEVFADRVEELTSRGSCLIETAHVTKSGRKIPTELNSRVIDYQGKPAVLSVARDITERKRQESEREATLFLLRALGQSNSQPELIGEVTGLMQRWSGCEAVGVRLRDGPDYPYYETRGFPPEFVEAERFLCERDLDGQVRRDEIGSPILECMCGNVLCGRFDPSLPFFTEHGSFWTNSTTDLLASTSEEDRRARTRNRCHGEGYESVALVPLRHGGETFGLLQFNDSRRDVFDEQKVATLERLAGNLAVGLAQRRATAALEEADLRKEEAIAAGNVGLFDWDLKTDHVQYSYEWKAQIGYAEDEIGEGVDEWRDRLHPEDRPTVVEHIRGVIEGRHKLRNEFRFRHKDGSYRWILAQGSLLRDESGEPARVLGSHVDITERKRTEEALARSEREKSLVLNSTYEMFTYYDLDLRIQWANRAAGASVGKTAEEIVGKHCYEVWHGREEPCEDCPLLLARETKQWQEAEITTPDGRIWFLRGSPVLDDDGNLLALVEFGQDITDRKQAEEALRESEASYRRLIETMPYGVEEVDLEGRMVFLNEAYHHLLGYEPGELVGTHIWDHDPSPEEANQVKEYFAYIKTEQPPPEPFTSRNVRKDGSIIDVHVDWGYRRDENGELTGFTSIVTDITERNRAEEALRESEERFRSLVQAAPVSILALRDGKYVFANPAAADLLGYDKPQDVVGLDAMGTVAPEYRDVIRERMANIDQGGSNRPVEIELLRADGERVWSSSISVSVTMDGQRTAIIVGQDITDRKEAERALRESEAKFRSYVATAPIGIFVTDEQGLYVEANEAAEEITGYTRGDLLGMHVTDVISEDSRDAAREHFATVVREGKATCYITAVRKDCALRYWRVDAVRLSPTRFLGFVSDITDLRQAEETLKQTLQMSDDLVRTIPSGLFIYQFTPPDRLRLISANPAAERLTGIRAADWRGREFDEIWPGARERGITEAYLDVMRTGKAHQCEEQSYEDERLVGVFRLWAFALPRNRLAVTFENITERKRAEAALRRLESAVEQAMDGIAVADMDGNIVFVNRAWADMHGQSKEQAIRAGTPSYHTDEQYESGVLAALERVRTDGEWEGEVGHVRADGTTFDAWMSCSLIRDEDGEPVGMVAMARDITDEKVREAQLRQAQKMEAVGRLAAGVAHDFNNQLTVILGYCDMLAADRQEDASLREPLVQIHEAAKRAQSTTGHLLAFSRRQTLEPEVVSVGDLLHEMAKPASRMIGEDIQLVVAVPPGVRPLFVDRAGLQQVIMNLVVNARDAMPGGGKLILQASTVSLGPEEAAEYPDAVPGEYVLIEVIDNGVGMGTDTLERIFEPFFTTKETGKGTGLGMPMVQGFVRQSNGFMRVDSTPGEGTAVRVLLPSARDEATHRPAPEAGPSIDEGAESGTILVVEDEAGVRSFAVSVLRKAGYTVFAAAGPAEAMRLTTEEKLRPDLVVSDVIMPEMRGDELAEKLRSLEPAPEFLFFSGYANVEAVQDEILHKPFAPAELLARVRKRLARRASGRGGSD